MQRFVRRMSRQVAASWGPRVPSGLGALVPVSTKHWLFPPSPPTVQYLRQLMKDNYQVKNLVNVDPKAFKERIEAFSALDDASMEGYTTIDGQRRMTVQFRWGADHDFGDFQVKGMAKERPIWLLSHFMDLLPVLPRRLDGLKVLDIGCWTGGTSLALAAMGASVVAIDEVKKYIDCLSYLRDAFAVEHFEPRHLSLYGLKEAEFYDSFDIVLFAGVLYHLSDPVLGLRITFDVVKPGGMCLMETAVMRSHARIVEYAGRNEIGRGESAVGANWFYPSPSVAAEMMREVGYSDVRTVVQNSPRRTRDRMIAVGTKVEQVDMLRAGLSVPDVR